MKVWALTDGPVREGKYLVVRRDGTTPAWGHFVMADIDPAVPAALLAYASEARKLGWAADYCASVEELASLYAGRAAAHAADHALKQADPDKGPHRKDLPAVIAMMRGEGDVAVLVAERDQFATRVEELERALRTAADQFEFYEASHRAKKTPDADAKAEVNRQLAAELRALLPPSPGNDRG